MTIDPYAPPKDPQSTAKGEARFAADGAVMRVSEQEANAIKARLKSLNARSIAFMAPGVALQLYGWFTTSVESTSGALLRLGGTLLMGIGLTYYARTRGRSPWFATLGIFSLAGAAIVSRLPKNCVHCRASVGASTACRVCDAPVWS